MLESRIGHHVISIGEEAISVMPELPEVEITRQGIEPHLVGRQVQTVILRRSGLRYPFPERLAERLAGQEIMAVRRRAKYILVEVGNWVLLLHLGMSGSLRLVSPQLLPEKHDHFDLVLESEVLRFRDPRRFGAVLLLEPPAEQFPLLAGLGWEPLSESFDGKILHTLCRGRKTPIKQWMMDGGNVVGVGNIYASESLFRARIHPQVPAGDLSMKKCELLAVAIKQTLQDALAAGGSSLKDFVHSDGSSGYFQQQYAVYGRDGEVCRECNSVIERCVMGQRATFFCPVCQKFPKSSGLIAARA